jgi:tetratricopeptide (TPR) repeat protein
MIQRIVASGVVVFLCCFAAGADEADTLPSAATIVQEIIEVSGIEAAQARFDRMLMNRDAYEFDGNAFVALGRRLQNDGDFQQAIAVYTMTLEAFPETTWLHRRIAAVHFAAGDEEGSFESMEAMHRADNKRSLEEYLEGDHPELLETADQVIAAHLEATGGLDAWRSVKTLEAVVGAYDSRGRLFRMVRRYRYPLQYRQQVQGSNRASVTDGQRVWRVVDGERQETDDTSLTHMASAGGWFLDPDRPGVEYEMLGFEFFHDAPVYRLRRTYATGREEELIFSADQGYLTEIHSVYPRGNPVMYSYASFWDYRPVGRILVPHVFIRNVGPLGPPHGIVVEKVTLNLPLDDSLFAPPHDAAPADETAGG